MWWEYAIACTTFIPGILYWGGKIRQRQQLVHNRERTQQFIQEPQGVKYFHLQTEPPVNRYVNKREEYNNPYIYALKPILDTQEKRKPWM